jgi:hypothetical protein
MLPDRTHHGLTHLALALAGVCLTSAEVTFLPEIVLVLPVYLGLIALAWWRPQRKSLPAWVANLLAVVIAGSATLWLIMRSNNAEESWSRDVPLAVLVIPHLGAVLMALLVVRLFRPPTPVDFWMLQGLGLLQVALACVLASGTIFGTLLIVYLIVAGCAIASHERHVQSRPGSGIVVENVQPAPGQSQSATSGRRLALGTVGFLKFALRWGLAVALLVMILNFVTPRLEGPDWDPLARFGVEPPKLRLQTGFGDEIDLTRTGRVENDMSPAFTLHVEDRTGRPVRGLLENQRFRGLVLDQYSDGKWKLTTELKWPQRGPRTSAPLLAIDRADGLYLKFRVPRETNGLFLAEPISPGRDPHSMPVAEEESISPRRFSLFYEATGCGTVMPTSFLTDPEYRYVQTFQGAASRERYPAVRVTDTYQTKIARGNAELRDWSIEQVRSMDRQRFASADKLLPHLERMREPGAFLPPIHYEPLARLLSDYLSNSGEYTWSLDVQRDDRRIDPVIDFLKNVKQGPCDRFASALALLVRAYGIPARLVRGFRGAEYQGDGNYVVFNNHAHAWVEVLVHSQRGSGFDWLILDPSPPEAVPTTTALVRLQRSSQALWRDLLLGYRDGETMNFWQDLISGRLLSSLAPWLGLLVVLATLAWGVRRRQGHRVRRKRSSSLYHRMVELLARQTGLHPASDETPGEVASRASAWLADRPATALLADVPAHVVAVYYQMRFGGSSPEEAGLQEAILRLDALELALRRG